MIRAVVDTNVLISGLIKPRGRVGPVLDLLRDGAFTYLYSDVLLEELLAKLSLPRLRDKYHLNTDDVDTILSLLLRRGEPVHSRRRIRQCRDPRDDMLLEAAASASADYLVSGDRDLQVLHPFEGIPIVSPARFLEVLSAGG